MRKLLFIITISLLASSCSVYKKYTRPELVTDNLYGANIENSQSSIADISWQDLFTDPHLQQLITLAIENNPDMQIAAERIVAAQATLRSAKLAFLPSLSFDPSFSTNTSNSSSYTLPLNASWAIDITGNILNNKRSAQSAYEQSNLYRQSVQTALISAVASNYYTLLMLDAQMAISRSTAATWKENVRIMKAMKLAGMTNEASVSQTEANSCEIETSLFDLEYKIIGIENAIALLIGSTPQKIVRGTIHDQSFNNKLDVGIPAQLLSRRPDVRSAEKRLEQAFYNTNIARGSFIPNLILGGSLQYGLTGWLASFTAKMSAEIFNAGKNSARLKVAQAEQQQALISFRHTLLEAGSEVNDALTKCHTARSKQDIRTRQIAALQSAVNSTQQLMRHSESTYLEVLTAQQKLLSAQLSQIADKVEEIQGIIALYHALGGGIDQNEDISALPKRVRK